MSLKAGRFWVVGLVVITCYLLLTAAATGATRHPRARVVLLTTSTRTLKRGRAAIIQASVPKGEWCRLSLSRPEQAIVKSAESKARSALAQFQWTVPPNAAGGQQLVTVSCALSRAQLSRGLGLVSRSELLSVSGHATRRGPRTEHIRVFYPLSHGLPFTGKGGGSYPAEGTVLIRGSAWLDGHGVNVYSDGAAGGSGHYQCVELINRLITTLHWSPVIWGNANLIYGDASTAYFQKYRNGSGYRPVPGDIVVWGGGYGGYGHVQVVNTDNGSSLTVVEQNSAPSGYNVDPISSSGTIAPRGSYYVEGFLHAKADTIGQAPKPPSAPTPTSPPPTSTTPTSTPPTSTPPTSTPPTSTPPTPTTYVEHAGPAGATTFLSYVHESGVGPRVGDYQAVQVTCRVQGLAVSDGNRWYYRVASSPWNNTYYASADSFYNEPGVSSGSLLGTPFVDTNVPTC